MRIGVITRGKYGSRLIENLRAHTDFEIVSADIQEILPEYIEHPDEYIRKLDFDECVFKVDLLISYALQPDITPVLVRMAAERGVKSAIVIGSHEKVGALDEFERISEEYGIHVHVSGVCCALTASDNPTLAEYSSKVGSPVFRVEHDGRNITKVDVLRGSPCGSTYHVAKNLVGAPIEEAPIKAGWYTQIYPCRATRGLKGNIHKSAEIHKKAMEEALGKSN